MTIAYWCVLFMGLFPYVAAGIAKKGFEDYDNGMPRQWLAKQTGFRARANAAQANLFESLPLFFAAVIIASMANHSIHCVACRLGLRSGNLLSDLIELKLTYKIYRDNQ